MCCPMQIKLWAGCIVRRWLCVCLTEWVCINLSHSTIRKWHYGNVGITMKRAARGMLRATFYIPHLISQPTAFAPIYPIYESPLNLQLPHLISPPPCSSSLVREQQLLSHINCFPPGPSFSSAYYSDLLCQPADNPNCWEQLTRVHLLYSVNNRPKNLKVITTRTSQRTTNHTWSIRDPPQS